MYQAKAYSAASKTSPLASASIPRRETTARDVQIEILFCGICHSDLHQARDEWNTVMPTVYPCVPGHEIVGRVTKVGAEVTKFKAGDLVGVGCLVDSDHTCPACKAGVEVFCPNMTLTYNSPDRHHTAPVTYGGYSESVVVDQDFVLRRRRIWILQERPRFFAPESRPILLFVAPRWGPAKKWASSAWADSVTWV